MTGEAHGSSRKDVSKTTTCSQVLGLVHGERQMKGSQTIPTSTVCAEIITELILERAGPVIFKTLLLEVIAFRLIPVIFLQGEEA